MKFKPFGWLRGSLFPLLIFWVGLGFGSQKVIDAPRHIRVDGFSISDLILGKYQLRSLIKAKPESIFVRELEVFLDAQGKPQAFTLRGVSPDSDSIFSFLNRISNEPDLKSVSLNETKEISISPDSFFTLFRIVGSISESIESPYSIQVKNDLNFFSEPIRKMLTDWTHSMSVGSNSWQMDEERELALRVRELKERAPVINPSYHRLRLPNGVQDVRAMSIRLKSVSTEKAVLSLFQLLGVDCELQFRNKGEVNIDASNEFVGMTIEKILLEKCLGTAIEDGKVIVFSTND